MMMTAHPARLLVLLALTMSLPACGYTEQEWQAQLDKYRRLLSQQQATEKSLEQLSKELTEAQQKVAKLEADLQAAGVDIGKLNLDPASRSTEISSLGARIEEQQQALAEQRRRAQQLERIKQRFERLRGRLDELTSAGLAVTIRRNRMTISLPGDVLFAAGQDKLKADGEEILGKVAAIIKNDPALLVREYQVVGHTDNQLLRGGGIYRDLWGLSLMRARQVLIYLIDPDKGGLPADRWSAAGFGETAPIAENDTPEGREQNRRCEIIVVPSTEEMVDLNSILQ